MADLLLLDHLANQARRRALRVFRDRANMLEEESDEWLRRHFRLPRHSLVELCNALEPQLARQTNRTHPIPAHVQVLCSLGFLATGTFQRMVADRAGISQPSLSRVLPQVLDGIIRLAPQYIQFPYKQEQQRAIKRDFFQIAGFPNAIGAIDCTHVRIKAPSNEPYPYRNRKGYHSINVQIICDANMNILNAVTRWPGGCHDSFIVQNSSVGMRLEQEAAGDAWLVGMCLAASPLFADCYLEIFLSVLAGGIGLLLGCVPLYQIKSTQCGNFAVLVDLHVLPLGGGEDTGWFSAEHVEDVAALVRDSVDQRVKQYTEFLHNRGQPKHKKELATSKALYVKGNSFDVVANFVKRHLHLRCIVKQQYGELRVFPERYVVCVSCPEDASAHHGNPSLAATELNEQSRSEYFSRTRETQELLNSTTKTKRRALQKIAKKSSVQQEQQDLNQRDQRQELSSEKEFPCPGEIFSSPRNPDPGPGELVPLPEPGHQADVPCGPGSTAQVDRTGDPGLTPAQQAESGLPGSANLNQASAVSPQRKLSQGTGESKRCKPSTAGEDPHLWRAKRACPGQLPISAASELTVQAAHALEAQTSKHDPLPSPPLPLVKAEAKAQSKAFPVSECNETTLEVELLTPGKRAQRLPLTSNNTEQTNQNRLAASLRGLSVKPASSASISSRSTGREEGSENVPRTSRLRRLKRS